jgi:pSer/pThr/pTyr-binding forkhead associated (FHA) protein
MSSSPARQDSAAPDRLLRIRVTLKGRPVRTYTFKKEEVTVGRNPDADLFLDNPGVSRDHIKLERAANGDYVVHDLGSANGTMLNEQPVTRKFLANNDVIQLGKFALWITYEDDRRGTDSAGRSVAPTAEDGTMVLSATELEGMLKKTRQAQDGPVAGPWPGSGAAPAGAASPAQTGTRKFIVAAGFALGFAAGALVAILAPHFLKH